MLHTGKVATHRIFCTWMNDWVDGEMQWRKSNRLINNLDYSVLYLKRESNTICCCELFSLILWPLTHSLNTTQLTNTSMVVTHHRLSFPWENLSFYPYLYAIIYRYEAVFLWLLNKQRVALIGIWRNKYEVTTNILCRTLATHIKLQYTYTLWHVFYAL